MLGIIIGVLVLTFLIVIHEMGHFIVARRNGVEVEEFGVGFPPKVVGRTLGKGIMKCYYTINALPLGGFVKLKGENSEDTRPGSFGAASLWAKTKITVAGIAMNFIAAIVLLSIVSAVRMPVVLENQFTIWDDTEVVANQVQVNGVIPDGPFAAAGLETGDVVESINGEPVTSREDFLTEDSFEALLENFAGESVPVTYVDASEGEEVSTQMLVNSSDEATGLVEYNEEEIAPGFDGASIVHAKQQKTTWSSPLVGVGLTAQLSWETLSLLGDAVGGLFVGDTETASETVSGPVGIFYIFSQVGSLSFMLFIAGVVSLSLAIMNLLPIPALDGGRLAVTAIFEALNKPLTEKTENAIHGTGMAFLLLLIIFITVLDVSRFFG